VHDAASRCAVVPCGQRPLLAVHGRPVRTQVARGVKRQNGPLVDPLQGAGSPVLHSLEPGQINLYGFACLLGCDALQSGR
jgi:hypothetical protein